MINNETFKTLTERRSIRKYKTSQITDEELNAVLEAGKYAPTAMNKQSPIIIAVQNPETVKKLSDINAEILGTATDPFYKAPTIILVLGDKAISTYLQDGSLVLSNMFNMAYSIGLGSCWIHRIKETFEHPEGKALLKEWGIEGDYTGIGSCILGYPDCELPEPSARKSDYVKIIK